MKSKEKTLVFDFGNVLIDLDYPRLFENFNKLFPYNWDIDDYPESIEIALGKYERGLISDDSFIRSFQQFNKEADPQKIVEAWYSLLGEIRIERLEMLKRLSGNYNLVLLSNINNLHLLYIHKYLARSHSIFDFEDRFFDNVFYSHLVKMNKPDPNIYIHVENQLSIPPENILFLDDKSENIEAAALRSWNVQLHSPEHEITDMIDEYISNHSFECSING